MKTKPFILATITFVVLAGIFVLKTFSEKNGVVPSVSVNTIDGQILSLDGYTGRPVLITFWATTCSTCIQEMPHLSNLYKELKNEGLEIISVAMYYDPPNRVVEFSEQKDIPYPVALDIEGTVARAFGDVNATPTSFLIGPDGTIIQKRIGELDIEQLRTTIKQLIENNKTNLS